MIQMLKWLLDVLSSWPMLVTGFVLGVFAAILYRDWATGVLLARAGKWDWVRRALRNRKRPPFWLYHKLKGSAVIEAKIRYCRPYLKWFFSEGRNGEIWLFNSDLNALSVKGEFDPLYRDLVAPNTRIGTVRVLLRRDTVQTLIDGTDSALGTWMRIRGNLDQDGAGRLRECVVYCFDDELPEAQRALLAKKEFVDYTSDEGFVFYTRGDCLHGCEAMCIHRRLSGDGSESTDLRITVTASRDDEHDNSLARFMSGETWQSKFEVVFAPGEHWKKITGLVSARIAYHSGG